MYEISDRLYKIVKSFIPDIYVSYYNDFVNYLNENKQIASYMLTFLKLLIK